MSHESIVSLDAPDRVAASPGDLVRALLDQDRYWVHPGDWATFLRTADRALLVPTRVFTRDRCVAVRAWLYQQRHALHRLLGMGETAPDGWIETTMIWAHVAAGARPRQAVGA